MNDGKIIIDRIMAEADKEIEAFMLEGKREADAIMKAAEENSIPSGSTQNILKSL